MNDKYILSGNNVVSEPNLTKWAQWHETGNRRVNETISGDTRVSTVFLGLDHSFSGDKILLFETMVFGGSLDGEMDRCSTWKEAEEMHKKMCKRAI